MDITKSLNPSHLNKQEQRRILRHKRQQLTPVQLHQADIQFAQQLKQHPAFLRANRIGFYIAHKGEVPMQSAIQLAWAMKKHVALPLLHPLYKNTLVFKHVLPTTQLKANKWGLLEPQLKQPTASILSLDCVIVPLVGFDQYHNRLGQGGGFYDRTFSPKSQQKYGRLPTLIGAAYGFQKVVGLQPEPWDIPLDYLVSLEPSL